jgi:hypothetical protein
MKDIIFPITYKTDTKGLQDAESGLDKLGKFAKTAGIAIAAGLAVAGAAAVAFGAESLKAAAEAEAITRGLENAAKNAGVFGDSSLSIGKATEALDKHSKKLGELTGIDDELINQLKTGWLAVPDLAAKGTDGINKLAEAAADIAKGTGKDISAVAMAFTKISGDSETALSKLNRIGIVLSDQQKETYQNILDTNGEIAAQDYLLQELGDKYAGAAAAAANPFERLDVIFGNLKETIGGALLPAFEAIIPFIQSFIEELVASPDFNLFLEGMSGFFAEMIDTLPTVIDNLKNFGNDVLPVLKEILPFVTESLGFMVDFLLGVENSKAGDTTRTFADSMNDLANSFKNVTGFIRDLRGAWDGLPEPIKWAIGQLSKALNPFSGLDVFFKDKNTSYAPATGRGLKLAAGGIIPAMPGGTPATIGEAGPEAVIPLDRLDRMMGRGGGSTITINVSAGMGTDGAALGEQIVTAIRKYERTSGKVFAAA